MNESGRWTAEEIADNIYSYCKNCNAHHKTKIKESLNKVFYSADKAVLKERIETALLDLQNNGKIFSKENDMEIITFLREELSLSKSEEHSDDITK
jgi:hypothetical protein